MIKLRECQSYFLSYLADFLLKKHHSEISFLPVKSRLSAIQLETGDERIELGKQLCKCLIFLCFFDFSYHTYHTFVILLALSVLNCAFNLLFVLFYILVIKIIMLSRSFNLSMPHLRNY